MKHSGRIFIALFAFFITVAVGALMMLGSKSSVFNRDSNSIGAKTAVMSQTVVGDEPSKDMSISDDFADTPSEEVTEDVREDVTEAAAEEVSEDEPAAAEQENDRAKRYFTFVTSTTYTVLRVREAPSEDAAIIHKLSKKTPGYVLQPGNTWSKVVTAKGSIGYCATEYLDMTEVSPEDFPQEYRDMVLAPEEDLSY